MCRLQKYNDENTLLFLSYLIRKSKILLSISFLVISNVSQCFILPVLFILARKKKEAKSFLSLSPYKDFLLLKTHVTIGYHITDHKLSYFRLYLLINL